MGVFSWLDCENNKQIKIGDNKPVYVLIPEEFGGGHIEESFYWGYGEFGGYDIYELVAEWNRKAINPDKIKLSHFEVSIDDFGGLWWRDKEKLIEEGKTPEEIEKLNYECKLEKYNDYVKTLEKERETFRNFCILDDDELEEKYGNCGSKYEELKRNIGILLACYNKDNKKLPYPIKITHNPNAVYENCKYSKSDPNQGCD